MKSVWLRLKTAITLCHNTSNGGTGNNHVEKTAHNHNNNQTNPKPQPNNKNKPTTNPPKIHVHKKTHNNNQTKNIQTKISKPKKLLHFLQIQQTFHLSDKTN